MTGVLAGFAALAAVIAVGWVVGRTRVVGAGAEGVLSQVSFFVATPALLFLTLSRADTTAVLSYALVGSAGSAAVIALLYAGLAWWRWRLPAAQLATGGMASSYVNAGTLGIPVSVYVLGDASYVAPVLLFQVLVMAPIGLAVLARSRTDDGAAPSRWQLLTQPLRTPVVLGCGLGLLAYGMSLHGAPRPGAGEVAGQVWLAVLMKTVAQPAVAYALGRWVADLDGLALLAVTVTSALPTAQNVFVYAAAYDRGTVVVRDVVLLSTVLSVPAFVAVAALLA